jgi:hypothetical protein
MQDFYGQSTHFHHFHTPIKSRSIYSRLTGLERLLRFPLTAVATLGMENYTNSRWYKTYL